MWFIVSVAKHILLLVVAFGCASKLSKVNLIEGENQKALPTATFYYPYSLETKDLIKKSNPHESSNIERKYIRTYRKLSKNKLQVTIKIVNFSGEIDISDRHHEINGNGVFSKANLSFVVNCKSLNVTEKKGFDQAIESVENLVKPAEIQGPFIDFLVSFVETAPTICKEDIGPFTKYAGRLPGSTWQEKVPIKGFESEKLDAKFLGWSKIGDIKFAVLEGRAKADSNSKLQERIVFDTYMQFSISEDWKIVKRSVSNNYKFIGAGKTGSGNIRIESVSRVIKEQDSTEL